MGWLTGGSSNNKSDSGGEGPRNQYKKQKQNKKSKKKTGGGPIALQAFKAVADKLEAASRPYNTKLRKEYISKYNTRVPPSERINMSDEQIGSSEGLAALREIGYQTNQDQIDGGNRGGNQPILGSKSNIQKKAVKDAPDGPTSAELELTEEERLQRIKRKGRRATKLSSTDDELTLSKKTLLG